MKHRKYCYTNFIKRIYIAICARDTYYAKVKKIYEIINLMRGCIMTRVLFLDIDGVLNSNFWNDSHQKEISDGTLIDEEKIKILATLIKRTDAKLVLHTV